MLIYNVTTFVQHNIHNNWVQWMQTNHIPQVMATGCFTHYQFVRLLEVDETDGVTYATQYFAASKPNYEKYIAQFAGAMRKEVTDKWGDAIIGFRSLMQVVA